MATNLFISLIRVSTKKQGESQLGLKAQRSSIKHYINAVGGNLIQEYNEVESGVNKEIMKYGASINIQSLLIKRQTLLAAVEQCQLTGAILLVKEISRLTRSPLVYEYLKATGVKFKCVDYPEEDNVILGMRIQFAAEQAFQISRKTKEGLAKSEKQLGATGPKHLLMVDHKARVKVIIDRANNNENNIQAGAIICTLREGGMSFSSIASYLAKNKFKSATGKVFDDKSKGARTSVKRLYDRFCVAPK